MGYAEHLVGHAGRFAGDANQPSTKDPRYLTKNLKKSPAALRRGLLLLVGANSGSSLALVSYLWSLLDKSVRHTITSFDQGVNLLDSASLVGG